jgi:ribosome maturation protein SDO1
MNRFLRDEKQHAAFNLARIKRGDKNFEVVIFPEKAVDLRSKYKNKEPEEAELLEALKSTRVFKDAQKGLEASEEDMKEVFGVDEEEKVALEIIKNGEIQLTTQQRHEIVERKKNKIIDYIARAAVDPRSNTPHPRQRIESAMDEAKFRINEFKSAKEQIPEVVDKIKSIIPLSFKTEKLRIIVPAVYTGKVYGYLKRTENVKREDWLDNGELMVELELPAAGVSDLIDEINNMTKGDAEIKRLES